MSGEVPLETYQLPAAQHSSLNDILQPFKAWSCSNRTYIPNTFEVQRYLDKDPRVRLEEMSNYLLADPSWVVELDKHMFENYDMWYVIHRQRSLNVAYALRRDWSVAGILGGWSFEGVQDMESWIYSGLLYGDALTGAAGKHFRPISRRLVNDPPRYGSFVR